MKECNGVPNIMCSKCVGIITHLCDCPKKYIRFCECDTPKPLEFEEEEEVDIRAEINE